jgi:glyceraldehyde-3-phosphate dehydrogenase/erythrose-4-phosphate dehydrogenase
MSKEVPIAIIGKGQVAQRLLGYATTNREVLEKRNNGKIPVVTDLVGRFKSGNPEQAAQDVASFLNLGKHGMPVKEEDCATATKEGEIIIRGQKTKVRVIEDAKTDNIFDHVSEGTKLIFNTTGLVRTTDDAKKLMDKADGRKNLVVICTNHVKPGKDEEQTPMLIRGHNDNRKVINALLEILAKKGKLLVSVGSCSTNAYILGLDLLKQLYGKETVSKGGYQHALTNSDVMFNEIEDGSNGVGNTTYATSNAVKALAELYPKAKFGNMDVVRVWTPTSRINLEFAKRTTSKFNPDVITPAVVNEGISQQIKTARFRESVGFLKGDVTAQEIVNRPERAVISAQETKVSKFGIYTVISLGEYYDNVGAGGAMTAVESGLMLK